MSRLILYNSMLLQSANKAVAVSAITASQPTILAARRWKSLLRSTRKQRMNSSLLSQPAAVKLYTDTTPLISEKTTIRAISSSSSSNLNSFISSQQQQRTQATMPSAQKFLQMDNINPNFILMEYAVRGPLVIRAGEIEKELQEGAKKPFKQVIRANIGDCHAMGQRPITFLRQLLALTFNPSLLDSSDFPEDVKKRALDILNCCQGCSVGSYTDSAGLLVVRKQVADFIAKRDGFPSNWQNVFLTAGATPGIKSILSLVNCDEGNKKAGVLVPIPQYPLYSATIAEYGMERIGYYLDEETNWGLSKAELQRSLAEAKQSCAPRALVIINPGNPTGQVLKHENIVEIIKFAYENKLLLLADEVYQDNIYDSNSEFHSFKKVMMEMGAPYKDMEMVSFMSTSKGYLGECGIRGGYMEVMNFDASVMATLSKALTASLCGTTAGQVAVSALVNHPQPGESSYKTWLEEKNSVLAGLKERAQLVYNTMNSFEGFKVNIVQGAMYAFPSIEIPAKAIAEAKSKNMTPDTFYAFELLEATGICIVPGSGFGQKPGTYHFRTTILPQTEQLKQMLQLFKNFHTEFMKKYK